MAVHSALSNKTMISEPFHTSDVWPFRTPAAGAERGRLLVVEDDPALLGLHLHSLRGAGFDAVGVPNAEACFAALCVELPELILLDINLPDCNGRTLCRRLTAD